MKNKYILHIALLMLNINIMGLNPESERAPLAGVFNSEHTTVDHEAVQLAQRYRDQILATDATKEMKEVAGLLLLMIYQKASPESRNVIKNSIKPKLDIIASVNNNDFALVFEGSMIMQSHQGLEKCKAYKRIISDAKSTLEAKQAAGLSLLEIFDKASEDLRVMIKSEMKPELIIFSKLSKDGWVLIYQGKHLVSMSNKIESSTT